eukprot:jgi/Ulvmu1/8756/UM048_0010.1
MEAFDNKSFTRVSCHSLAEEVSQPEQKTHPKFEAWCAWLRMSPTAAASWCRLCDEPAHISSCYFAAAVAYITTYSVLFFGGVPFPTWRVHIAQSLLLLAGSLHAAGMWHGGPDFSKTVTSACLTVLLLITSCFLTVSVAVQPIDWLPFNNRLTSTAVLAVGVFSMNLTSACGSVPTHHPPFPHRTVRQPIWNATIDAVRAMDSVTDLTLTRIFFDQARSGCYWLGVAGRCGQLQRLASFSAAFAVAKLLRHAVLHFLGGRISRSTIRGRWVILGGYILNLACECGITTLALLNIFSAGQHPGRRGNGLASRRVRQNIAVTVISFAFSVAVFAVSIAGMRKTVARLRSLGTALFNALHRRVGVKTRMQPDADNTNLEAGHTTEISSSCLTNNDGSPHGPSLPPPASPTAHPAPKELPSTPTLGEHPPDSQLSPQGGPGTSAATHPVPRLTARLSARLLMLPGVPEATSVPSPVHAYGPRTVVGTEVTEGLGAAAQAPLSPRVASLPVAVDRVRRSAVVRDPDTISIMSVVAAATST